MEEIMNTNVMEEEETNTNYEVVNTNEVDDRNYDEPVYYPASTDAEGSNGPNKALIALAIGGGLLIAKPAIKKIKSLTAKAKAKKEQKEHDRIMAVLKETGLVVEAKAEEVKTAPTEEVKAEETDVQTTPETTETEEKVEDKK